MPFLKRIPATSWWKWVVGVDLFLVLFTLISSYIPSLPGSEIFNLGAEMNVAVWWNGICLLAIALLVFELFSTTRDEKRKAWLLLSIIFAGLSLDEIGSLHERIVGLSDIIWYASAGAIALGYCLVILFRRGETRRTAAFILSGFLLFGLVAGQEFLEHTLSWPKWLLGIRLGVEEGTELVGTLLCLWGVAEYRKPQKNDVGAWDNVIPNPFHMKYLPLIVAVALVIHSIATLFIRNFPDLDFRGNPAAWFPSSLFFLLFSATWWRRGVGGVGKRNDRTMMCACLLLWSVSAMAFPHFLLYNYYSPYIISFPLFIYIYARMCVGVSIKYIVMPFIGFLMLLAGFFLLKYNYFGNVFILKYILIGTFAYLIFLTPLFIPFSYSRKILESNI